VKVPYEEGIKEIGADGSEVQLQVGAVVMLPDGFTLAPQDRWTDEIKEETEGVYFTQYSDEQPNILLVGPIPGDQNQEIVFPVLSPDPATDSNIHFGKYQIHVGGNRGRGQVYPTGEKSNNTVFTAPAEGKVASIDAGDNGASVVTIQAADGTSTSETIPVGPQLLVNVGDTVAAVMPSPTIQTWVDSARWTLRLFSRILFASTAYSPSSPRLPSHKSCWC
jgi:apocytochrome f